MTEEQMKELREGRAAMATHAATLPEGDAERAEYETAIATTDDLLRTYALTGPTPVVPAGAATDDADLNADLDAEEAQGSDGTPDVDNMTAEQLAQLRTDLAADGFDVGDEPEDLVAGGEPRTYALSGGGAVGMRAALDTRLDALGQSAALLPFEVAAARTALYALVGLPAVTGPGLRVYSRDAGGAPDEQGRMDAAQDLLNLFASRPELGLTRAYTRAPEQGGAQQPAAAVTYAMPVDVPVNGQSASLAHAVQAFAQERGLPLAEAVKLYEREKGKVTLKR